METIARSEGIRGVIEYLVNNIGLRLIPFLGAVAFFLFVWGIARFIRAAGNEKELKDSKNIIIWGIVGMFVLVAVWGIIAFLRNEFGWGSGTSLFIPQIRL